MLYAAPTVGANQSASIAVKLGGLVAAPNQKVASMLSSPH